MGSTARTPRDADHVQIVDDGNIITAVWIADPAKAKDPRAVLDGPVTPETLYDYERVAEATRFYKRWGATFSGWVVTSGDDYSDPIPNKREALFQMKLLIADYFN